MRLEFYSVECGKKSFSQFWTQSGEGLFPTVRRALSGAQYQRRIQTGPLGWDERLEMCRKIKWPDIIQNFILAWIGNQ